MTRYACSSVTAFVPPNGVCAGHSVNDEPADPDFEGLSVDCPVCDPHLSGDPFWAGSAEEVPLTASEEKLLERQQREIELQRVADARADREFLHKQRLETEATKPAEKPAEAPKAAPKPASRAKARGASA